jgi:hypothetical protein
VKSPRRRRTPVTTKLDGFRLPLSRFRLKQQLGLFGWLLTLSFVFFRCGFGRGIGSHETLPLSQKKLLNDHMDGDLYEKIGLITNSGESRRLMWQLNKMSERFHHNESSDCIEDEILRLPTTESTWEDFDGCYNSPSRLLHIKME